MVCSPSTTLVTLLQEQVDLAVAINTETARSEFMIAPVLLEVRRQSQPPISLFSGSDCTVDPAQGLTGICDFIMSKNPEQLFIRVPVMPIMEAKNENLNSGFAQCIAAMIAAQIFNQQENNHTLTMDGAVTWRFFSLEGVQLLSVNQG